MFFAACRCHERVINSPLVRHKATENAEVVQASLIAVSSRVLGYVGRSGDVPPQSKKPRYKTEVV